MDREVFIEYLRSLQPNRVDYRCINLVSDYLKNKFNYDNKNFINNLALMDTNRFLVGRNNIIEEYIKEYDITTWVHNKDGKLLKVL